MRVTGTFNNTLNETRRSSASQRKSASTSGAGQAAPKDNGPKKIRQQIPEQEPMSRAEILRKLEKRHEPKVEEEVAVAKPENNRPDVLVKPLWDDAGEPDLKPPKAVSTPAAAESLAKELAGSSKLEKPEEKPVEISAEKSEGKTETAEKHTLKSDVSANDPKDPVTQSKLKHVLSSGAFQFSDKEKEALKDILGT